MKVYKIECCEGYRLPFYSDYNSLSILDAGKMLWKEELDFNGGLPFKFDFCHYEHKKKKKILGDFMHTNLTELWVVNEKSKKIIQQKYGEFIWFFPLESTDEQGNKYYSFLPSKYIEGLDVERLEFDEDHNHIQLFDGIYNISDISKYCFKDFVKDYPIFRIKQSGFDQNKGKAITTCEPFDIFALDEFVQFVKENNLTGFDFKEVYDSETFNSTIETSEETKAPVSEITTHNSGNFTMGKQMIPKAHEDGIFAAGDLHSTGECLEAEYFCGVITNSANSYTVYDIDDCDMAKDMEVTYSSGRLKSVYVNSGNEKVPVYMCFDFSSGSEPEGLSKAVNECVELCAAELLEELKNAQPPLGSLSQEYYYDGEQMDINLQDGSCNIYSIGNAASHMLRCICICAGEQYPGSSDFDFEIFGRILNSLHKKLSSEIPERFDVTDDFKLYEPEMYD